MESMLLHASFAWLTKSGETDLVMEDSVDVERFSIPMNPDEGQGWIEMHHLPLGMSLSRGIHTFTPAMHGQILPFANITADLAENTLCVQSARCGRVLLHDNPTSLQLIFGDGNDLFQYQGKLDFTPHIDASNTTEVTMLKVGYSALAELLGEEESQRLLHALKMDHIPSARVVAVPKPIRQILYGSIIPSLHGSMHILFSQARVLEYISALAVHFDKRFFCTVAHKTAQQVKITKLHEELMGVEGKVPTLDMLAKRYGVSARTLNDQFKAVYGMTIFVFLTDQRLEKAHALLIHSDTSMGPWVVQHSFCNLIDGLLGDGSGATEQTLVFLQIKRRTR